MLRARRVLSVSVVTALLSAGVAPYAVAAEVRHPTTVDAHLDVEVSASEVEEPTTEAPAGPDGRSAPLEAPIAFTGLWVELPDHLDAVTVRTSADGVSWSGWTELEVVDDDDAPDPGTEEAAQAEAAPRVTDLLTTEEARHLQVATEDAEPADLTVQFIDTAGLNESALARVARHLTPRSVPAEASTVPSWVQPRSAWGAAGYRGTPNVAGNGVQQVVLHHTASNNHNIRRADGTCDRNAVAAGIRGYQSWHQNGNGWSDLGYNVVIDPCGGVWEGREGGLDRAIIGAHAANWNTGSVGIAVMGNYEGRDPNPDILRALDRVVGWKAGIHGVNLGSSVTRTIGGVNRTAAALVGHRDVGQTACPGRIQNHLSRVRANATAQSGQWSRVPDGLGVATFRDITGSPHALNIENLVQRGITSGYQDGTFRPGQAINRAQVATFLARALGLAPKPGNRFPDVAPGFVHEGWINALVDAGVLSGYQNGTFRPNEPLRREHMAVVIARALELAPRPGAAAQFSDVTAYAGEIGAIAHAGITSGRPDGTFQPRSPVTRGQMATFLVNAIGVLER